MQIAMFEEITNDLRNALTYCLNMESNWHNEYDHLTTLSYKGGNKNNKL